jgi:hypothetical protein
VTRKVNDFKNISQKGCSSNRYVAPGTIYRIIIIIIIIHSPLQIGLIDGKGISEVPHNTNLRVHMCRSHLLGKKKNYYCSNYLNQMACTSDS